MRLANSGPASSSPSAPGPQGPAHSNGLKRMRGRGGAQGSLVSFIFSQLLTILGTQWGRIGTRRFWSVPPQKYFLNFSNLRDFETKLAPI